MAAITEEFKEQVAEALQELGYSIENAQEDTIDDASKLDNDVTLPGIKYQGGMMSSYIHMKIGVLIEYLNHPAYIGADDYWYLWDYTTQAYVKSAYAKGDDLHYDEMTPEEYQRLVEDVRGSIAFAAVDICEDIIDELQ